MSATHVVAWHEPPPPEIHADLLHWLRFMAGDDGQGELDAWQRDQIHRASTEAGRLLRAWIGVPE
jgi:hypothetical protein